jgi:O-antigen ligase
MQSRAAAPTWLAQVAPGGGVALLATVAGVAVSSGGPGLAIAGGIAGGAVLAAVLLHIKIPSRPGILIVEVPTVLLALSSLVFRLRDTNSIASNPLDTAGLVRLAFIGMAAMLCLMALLQINVGSGLRSLRTARPLWLYLGYICAATVGITQSVFPLLTTFRVMNLALAFLVVLTAYLALGAQGLERFEKTIFWFMVLHMATVWLGVVVFPVEALRPASPFPFRIEGVMPAMASDRLGEYGAIIFFWCFAARNGVVSDRVVSSRRLALGLEGFGLLCLLAAQYRTGYIAVALGVLIVVALRGRVVLAGAVALLGYIVVRFGDTLFQPFMAFLLRGQSIELASKLSGRTNLWSAAVDVWRESPIVGGGLETASRFQVLDSLDRGFTGSVHSTWIEALVGTGIVGIVLAGATMLLVLYRSYLLASRGGRWMPILVVSVLAVRSVTGSSIETFGVEAMLFLAIVMAVRDPQPFRLNRDDDGTLEADPALAFPAPGGIWPPGSAEGAERS